MDPNVSNVTGGGGGGITLLTEDGQRLVIDLKCAREIGIMKTMLQVTKGNAGTFPVPAVKSTIMKKVIEFLSEHKEDPVTNKMAVDKDSIINDEEDDNDDEEDGIKTDFNDRGDSTDSSEDDEEYIYEDYLANVTPWDEKFLDSLDLPTLIELTKAANYLNIPLLLDLCCRTIARMMTGLKAEEIRKKFNLPNDFTPEEEAKMAAEFAWIEE